MGSAVARRHSENVGQGLKFHTFSDRNVRRGGYTRNASHGNLNLTSLLSLFFSVLFNLSIIPLDKVLCCSVLVFAKYAFHPFFIFYFY